MSVTFISYRSGDADYTTHTLHSLEGASQSGQTQVVELITINGVTYSMVIDAGTTSTNGLNGWTPVLATHVDGDRTLLRVSDWTGGGGTKPAAGLFIGASGFVADMAQAVSVRGAKGDAGDLAALADGSIAKAKLSTGVQTSLDKADASVQDLAGMTVKVVAGTGAQKTAHRDALGLGPIATMTLPEAQSAVSGALVLSATNASANSAAIVAAGGGAIPAGTWPIAPISATVDITLTGAGKHRAILTSAADAAGYLIQSTGRVCIKDIGIRGVHDTVKGFMTIAAGTQSGVLLDTRNGSYVKDAAIYGFGNIGIGLFGDSSANDLGPSIGGCDIKNNFAGIDTGNALNATGLGEYAKIYGNTILENTYGIIVRSGNVTIGTNSLQYNGEGIWVVGGANNGAHGVISGNMINHSHRVSVRLENIGYGQLVVNNAIFSNMSSLIMTTCSGVQFNNNLIFLGSLAFSGPAWNSFADNVFYGPMPTIADTSGAQWRDNYSTAALSYVGKSPQNLGQKTFQATPSLVFTSSSGASGSNKCQNGDFVDATGWTAQAGWSISGGVANAASSSAYIFRALSGGVVSSRTYQVDFDFVCTAGSVRVGVGGNVISNQMSVSGPQSVRVTTTAGANDQNVYFAAAGLSGYIDNVIVREVLEIADLSALSIGATGYIYVGTTKYLSGAGSPEGAVTAAIGSEYTRTDGVAGTSAAPGTLKYVKTTGAGATGWVAVL
jgi:hypothetical protein